MKIYYLMLIMLNFAPFLMGDDDRIAVELVTNSRYRARHPFYGNYLESHTVVMDNDQNFPKDIDPVLEEFRDYIWSYFNNSYWHSNFSSQNLDIRQKYKNTLHFKVSLSKLPDESEEEFLNKKAFTLSQQLTIFEDLFIKGFFVTGREPFKHLSSDAWGDLERTFSELLDDLSRKNENEYKALSEHQKNVGERLRNNIDIIDVNAKRQQLFLLVGEGLYTATLRLLQRSKGVSPIHFAIKEAEKKNIIIPDIYKHRILFAMLQFYADLIRENPGFVFTPEKIPEGSLPAQWFEKFHFGKDKREVLTNLEPDFTEFQRRYFGISPVKRAN